jgi:hypothetical protein
MKDHHYIPTLNRNNPIDIFQFLRDHDGDPAVAVRATLLTILLTHDITGVHTKTQGPRTIPTSKLRCHLL